MTRKCGVNKNLYSAYNFDDHIWYQNKNGQGANQIKPPYDYNDLLHLANRCVKIGKEYWMKKVGGDQWVSFSNGDAEKEALNTWMGATLPSGALIDSDIIHTFFSGDATILINGKLGKQKIGSCPNIYQKIVIPMGPQFVNYDNHQYLNTWYDEMIEPDSNHLDVGRAVLMMIYGGLCDGTVDKSNMAAESIRVFDMVKNNQYDSQEFKFLMNWLAALVQYPGINLQTNVWLLGTLEGVGKGTLVDIMRLILGRDFVGTLNQAEIEAGWNDHLVGKQLVEINEFDTDGKWNGRMWNKWIKGHTIEPTFKVRQRNTTSYTVAHIGNFIGTSNVEDQTFIDEHDRRNQFIKTSDDTFWTSYAAGIQIGYFKKNPTALAAGFSEILNLVTVDLDFISRSFKNHFRQSIVSFNMGIIESWLTYDPTIERGQWRMAGEWYDDFKKWFYNHYSSHQMPTIHEWGRAMGKSESLGVFKKKVAAGQSYIFGDRMERTTVKLDEGVAAVDGVVGKTSDIIIYDLDVDEESIPDFDQMTPMQKVRAKLSKMVD